MAGSKIKGINIKIGADTTGLDKALSGIEGKSKTARNELVEVNRSLKNNKDSVVLWEQKQQLLSKAFETSKEKLNMLESAQKQVNKQLQNKKITDEQYRAFQREVENAKNEVNRFGGQLEEAESKIKDLKGAADKTSDSAENLGDELQKAGEQAENSKGEYSVLKGTLADLAADGIRKVTDALKDCGSQAMEFEDSVAKLSTIADDSVSIEKMEHDIMDLSNATGIAADELANTAYDAISAGQDTADAVGFVGEATNLARAGFADTASTLDLLTTILNAYGLESEKVTEVSDMLIQTQNLGKTTVGQLSSAMGKVIPTANACGVSLDQLAAGYAVMTAKGVATAETTTYINSMLNELSKSGTKSSDTLKNETGKSFQELVADGESLSDILSHIKDAADKQNLSFNDMWGSAEAGKAGLILLGDSAQDYNDVLNKMQNSSGATEAALEKLNTKSYALERVQNQLKNSMISTGKETLAALTPLAEKALPKIERAIDKFNKSLPKIVDGGQKILPLVKGVGTAFAAWKVAQKASAGAVSAKKLFDTVKTGDSVMKKFNATLKVNPVGAVVTGVTALTAAFIALKAAEKEQKTFEEKMTEQYQEEFNAVKDLRDNINGMKDDFSQRAYDIDSETQRTQDLWEELDNLTDSTGKVKEADKKRAEYILGELNDALDTEYTMTGNQIDQYKTMESEIDNLIEKKRAAAYIDSFSSESAKYAETQAKAKEAYETAYVNAEQAKRQIEYFLSPQFQSITGSTLDQMTPSEAIEKGLYKSQDEYNQLLEINRQYLEAKAKFDTNQALADENFAVYQQSVDHQKRLDEAIRANSEGKYSSVPGILYDSPDADRYTLTNSSDLAKRSEAFRNLIKKSNADLDLAIKTNSQTAVDEAFKALGETVEAGQKSIEDLEITFEENFVDQIQTLLDEGFDISELAKWGKESGISIAEVYNGNFQDLVQEQLDAGYDIRDLLVWGEASGYKIGDYFVDDFKNKVQEALDKGYKIDNLLEWAKESGYFIGDETQYELMKKIQESLDLGFNTDRLIEWAIENGITLGQLFGENFSHYAEQAFWADWNTNGVQSIQSASDEALYYAGRYGIGDKSNLKYRNPDTGEEYYAQDHPDWVEYYYNNPHPPRFFAKGGFLGSGQGIVAEAGPELIEIMNGGARITPLTGNARNTAVSGTNGAGGQKIFYSSYTINATIAGKYDVTRLAEDLEMERRRIEAGRGL